LVRDEKYEKEYSSKKYNVKIIKNGFKVQFICTLTNCLKAEFINAKDEFINKKLKEYILED